VRSRRFILQLIAYRIVVNVKTTDTVIEPTESGSMVRMVGPVRLN